MTLIKRPITPDKSVIKMVLILHADLSGLLKLCTFRPGDSKGVENLFATCKVDQNPPMYAADDIEGVILIRTRLVWGSRHSLDGPSEQFFSLTPDGKMYCRINKWYYGDKLHRPDGPAIQEFVIGLCGQIFESWCRYGIYPSWD